MKLNTIITLLSFILLASNANAKSSQNTRVLDIHGKSLQTDIDYFILPAIRGRGGGLTVSQLRNKTCRFDVIQDDSKASKGLPVTFSPIQKDIVLSSDLNIRFSFFTVWKVDNFDEDLRQWFVTTCGDLGNPGPSTISNWFKIEKYNDTKYYKLVFCPTVCSFCKVVCKDVGVFVKDGLRSLVLTDKEPFVVMFKKA